VLAAGLGCLALAVVAVTFPLGSMAGQLNAQTVASTLVALAFAAVGWLQDAVDFDAVRTDLGGTVQQALEPAYLSLWTGKVAS
jgi:hypothetical protein